MSTFIRAVGPADALRIGAFILAILAANASAMAGDPSSSSQIIWDDPPSQTALVAAGNSAKAAPAGSTSPIRDNFSRPNSPSVSSGPEKEGITWNKPAGRPSSESPGLTGSASPGPCREFQQRVTIEGRPQQVHGRACRQTDGSWRIVN
jgi:hypothetical protein